MFIIEGIPEGQASTVALRRLLKLAQVSVCDISLHVAELLVAVG